MDYKNPTVTWSPYYFKVKVLSLLYCEIEGYKKRIKHFTSRITILKRTYQELRVLIVLNKVKSGCSSKIYL